jgi:hypothetical protein
LISIGARTTTRCYTPLDALSCVALPPFVIQSSRFKISLQGEHSCRWLKEDDGGREATEILKNVSMTPAKASIAFVCSNMCNEKISRKRTGEMQGGGGALQKSEVEEVELHPQFV